MFKTLTTLVLIIGLTFSVNAQIDTPAPSPSSKMEQVVGLTDITIDYSKPAMRGRTIFGNLVPYGKVWRTGANLKTKITFSSDVTIDNKELKAGTYAILTVPTEDYWDIIFYTDTKGGGAPAELDNSLVALKMTVKTQLLTNDVQSFTFDISDITNSTANVNISWEKTRVTFDVMVPTDVIAMASIEKAMSGPTAGEYYQSAVYLLTTEKDIKLAKEWIDKAISMNDNPPFWQLRQQSLIWAANGDKKGAIEIAKESLAKSKEAGNDDYVKMNNDSIAEWSN
ncbi:MAG: DUF2911 domain-containing protein [Urechidicola sp.]|nr:DUF2911 domain-containing protein [Urechidicola sp.]